MYSEQIKTIIESLLGEYGWFILSIMVVLTFKQAIQKAVNSLFVFYGNDYNADDVVELNGQFARIIRVGVFKTTFFIYKTGDDGKVLEVKKFVVDNDRLKFLELVKPLQDIKLDSLECSDKKR